MIVETSTRKLDSGPTVFSISGRLTLGNSLMGIERAFDKLVADGVRQLIVDVAGLTSLDSAGIGMLIGSYGRMDQAGGSVAISGAQGLVLKSFDVVHIDRIISLYPDVDAAADALQSGTAAQRNGSAA
jgi:anti-anti-sigma factor